MSQLLPHNDPHDDEAAEQPPRPLDPNAPEDGPLKDQEDPEEPLEPVEPNESRDPVDHDRPHGVPPPSNDDYDDDIVDHEGADSFPASDPPAGW